MFPFPDIILASKSAARANMLRAAGLDFNVIPADVDERSISVAESKTLAMKLAEVKAAEVSTRHPEALVIGGDQVLECEGEMLHKAGSVEEAKDKLRKLSGKTHALHSGAAVAQDGGILWRGVTSAQLTMRTLSEDDIAAYTDAAGNVLTTCVGAYAIEGLGAWLFEKIEGDNFTIQGLPLLPLLGFLKGFNT
ncbi:MAG: Maf family protein [Alphaproteobacteria bacterium]|nr:Maf family protein [Alphaproteobacteria bacterium]MCD8569953.1 Maf family protein [Alphaproteobacteria bacterium]